MDRLYPEITPSDRRRERAKEYARRFRLLHPGYGREYYHSHIKQYREYQRRSYLKRRDTILAELKSLRKLVRERQLAPDLKAEFWNLPDDPELRDYCRYVLKYAYC